MRKRGFVALRCCRFQPMAVMTRAAVSKPEANNIHSINNNNNNNNSNNNINHNNANTISSLRTHTNETSTHKCMWLDRIT